MADFLAWAKRHYKVFFDIAQWQACIKEHDFLVGTRFHGTMLAIQAGVPALCIVHDSRTLELCRTMELPHATQEEVLAGGLALDSLEKYWRFDAASFDRRRHELAGRYREFLEGNGVLRADSGLHRFA
jgi:polysaccharide pyruvyl transferase WcaK-like protein